MSSRTDLAYWVGLAGAGLGILAGIVQWTFGNEIPEWTGDKLHPVQLGIITIVLSLLAGAAVSYLARNREVKDWHRWVAMLAIFVAAGICFTTVGRLWFVPGLLLIVAGVWLARGDVERRSA